MKKKALIVVLVICFIAIGVVIADDYVKNIVNVNAVGEVYFKPNIAFLSIGVEDVYKNAEIGQADVNKKISNFNKEITDIVNMQDIETSTIVIRRKYEYINRKREFVGYEVKQILKITITDFSNIGLIMDKGLRNGFNAISNLTFSNTEYVKYKREALELALLEAGKKAAVIGKTLGLKGLKVTRVIEGRSSFQPYSEKNEAMGRMLSSAVDSQPTQVFAGNLKAISNVNLDYSYSGLVNKK